MSRIPEETGSSPSFPKTGRPLSSATKPGHIVSLSNECLKLAAVQLGSSAGGRAWRGRPGRLVMSSMSWSAAPTVVAGPCRHRHRRALGPEQQQVPCARWDAAGLTRPVLSGCAGLSLHLWSLMAASGEADAHVTEQRDPGTMPFLYHPLAGRRAVPQATLSFRVPGRAAQPLHQVLQLWTTFLVNSNLGDSAPPLWPPCQALAFVSTASSTDSTESQDVSRFAGWI